MRWALTHMGEALRIAMVGEATREITAKAKGPISYRQQHEAAAGADACAIECACDFLAGDRWRQERGETVVGRAGRLWRRKVV